jgi:hypothetical protein
VALAKAVASEFNFSYSIECLESDLAVMARVAAGGCIGVNSFSIIKELYASYAINFTVPVYASTFGAIVYTAPGSNRLALLKLSFTPSAWGLLFGSACAVAVIIWAFERYQRR